MRRPRIHTLLFLLLSACSSTTTHVITVAGGDSPPIDRAQQPRLILFLVVDQLRGDFLPRFEARLGEGGFRRLLDDGVWYANAHYRHSSTFTAVGHATLATGAGPAGHGMAGNDWADRRTGARVYCVEDTDHHLLDRDVTGAHQGTSPKNLQSLTLGDELVLASGHRSRVFSVSIKDRGAILPGGKLGSAFWYSKPTGGFTSSSYYFDELPAWAASWNEAHAMRGPVDWELSQPREEYVATEDDRPCEHPMRGMTRTFPHKLDSQQAAQLLPWTPNGDEHTAAFALELLEAEGLGSGPTTDLLAVSFSCTDYIGHAFGPNSLEAEDNFLRLDRTLASFLEGVDALVDREDVLVVLSSDHGVASAPEHVNHGAECGDAGAGRFVLQTLLRQAEEEARARLGALPGEPWVRNFLSPSVYLDSAAVAASGQSMVDAERALADVLIAHPGVAFVATREELERGQVPPTQLGTAVARAFHPDRSGHLLLIPSTNWHISPPSFTLAAMHGTPYEYDTHVPILISGASVESRVVHERVAPGDIAPTLAAILGIESPPASDGRVLQAALPR